MTDTYEIAECVAIYLAARTVVHARDELQATRRARLRRHAGPSDLRRAKHALAAARAELDARREGSGWRLAPRGEVDSTKHAAQTGGYQVEGSVHASLLARAIESV